jgi:hypothetical protein
MGYRAIEERITSPTWYIYCIIIAGFGVSTAATGMWLSVFKLKFTNVLEELRYNTRYDIIVKVFLYCYCLQIR